MIVTEHAMLRYCERHLGFDRRTFARELGKLCSGAKRGRFRIPGTDLTAIVEEGRVVSIVPYKPNRDNLTVAAVSDAAQSV